MGTWTSTEMFGSIRGELPLALFDSDQSGIIEPREIARYDIDPATAPDGLITIRDLELEDGGIRPADANRNGRVDDLFAGNPTALKAALLSTAVPIVDVTCVDKTIANQRMLNVKNLLGAVP